MCEGHDPNQDNRVSDLIQVNAMYAVSSFVNVLQTALITCE